MHGMEQTLDIYNLITVDETQRWKIPEARKSAKKYYQYGFPKNDKVIELDTHPNNFRVCALMIKVSNKNRQKFAIFFEYGKTQILFNWIFIYDRWPGLCKNYLF